MCVDISQYRSIDIAIGDTERKCCCGIGIRIVYGLYNRIQGTEPVPSRQYINTEKQDREEVLRYITLGNKWSQ